jgi:hypothetical protein
VLVSQRYSPEDAELLRQPGLLSHFEKQLAAGAKDDPVLARSISGLQRYRGMFEAWSSPLSPATVKEIGAVAAELRGSFTGNSGVSR